MNKFAPDDKYKKLFNFLGRWVALNDAGLTIGRYLKERNVHDVAIYGFGVLGRHLLHEMDEAGINVVYGIDKRSDSLNLNIPFKDWSAKELLPCVDLLIVTAIADYNVIEREMCEMREYPVISLEELLADLENYRRNMNV